MSENTISKLKKLQREISDIQTNRARLEGKKEQLVNELNNRFGISNLTDAKKKLSMFERELDVCEKKVESIVEKMEEVVKVVVG